MGNSWPLGLRDACEECQCLLGTLTFCQELVLICIGVESLYNVVLVPTVQQSGSGICIHMSLSFGVPSHWGQSRVPAVYSWFSLVVYFIYSINSVYMLIPISQSTSSFPAWYVYIGSLSLFCKEENLCHLYRFHIYVLTWHFSCVWRKARKETRNSQWDLSVTGQLCAPFFSTFIVS